MILKIDGVKFIACFTRQGELKDVKKNQAIAIVDLDDMYCLLFENANGNSVEVEFSSDEYNNIDWINPIRAIEWVGETHEECTLELVSIKYY